MVHQRFLRVFLPLCLFLPFIMILSFTTYFISQPQSWVEAAYSNLNLLIRLTFDGEADMRGEMQWITPLHVAAGAGQLDLVKWLVANGSPVNAIASVTGETPLDSARRNSHIPVVEFLQGHSKSGSSIATAVTGNRIWAWMIRGKALSHLWFLWYLWLIIMSVALCLYFSEWFGPQNRLIQWVLPRINWLWLIPLTMLFQSFMNDSNIGPDTSTALVPVPHIYGYYMIFFGFGMLYYHDENAIVLNLRYWLPVLLSSLLVVYLAESLPKEANAQIGEGWPLSAVLLQALFPWLAIIGLVGMFREFFSQESATWRYIADSSYFLYITHLPLMKIVRSVIEAWLLPDYIEFILTIVVVTVVLLFIYEHLVRYRWLGTFLNGPRSHPQRIQRSV